MGMRSPGPANRRRSRDVCGRPGLGRQPICRPRHSNRRLEAPQVAPNPLSGWLGHVPMTRCIRRCSERLSGGTVRGPGVRTLSEVSRARASRPELPEHGCCTRSEGEGQPIADIGATAPEHR